MTVVPKQFRYESDGFLFLSVETISTTSFNSVNNADVSDYSKQLIGEIALKSVTSC